jgi:hypothetical protein
MRSRHLAGPETVDTNATLELVEAFTDLGVEFACGDDDTEFTSQSVRQGFGYLHRKTLLVAAPTAVADKSEIAFFEASRPGFFV